MNNKLPKQVFPFIWHFLKPYKLLTAICVILILAAGVWGPLHSMLVKKLINLLPTIQNGDTSVLIVPGILLILNFIVFDNVTWRTINYIWSQYIPVIKNQIMSSMLEYSLYHSQNFYLNTASGKILQNITNLTEGIDKILDLSKYFLRALSLIIATFIIAYTVNPIFSLILIIWFICFTGFNISTSKKGLDLADKTASAHSNSIGELSDVFSNHHNIRIFSRRAYENTRIRTFLHNYQKAYTKIYLYSTLIYCVSGALIAVMMSCAVSALIYLYGQNLISMGDFALILGLSMETANLMWWTMSHVHDFSRAIGQCKQSLSKLILPFEIADKPNATDLQCAHGGIKFESVQFAYNDANPIFINKSVEIPAGQKVGLVGYSGGGKSTFVNLMLRLYDVAEGAILIDGQNIKDVTQDSLRNAIAMIPQDPSLFNRTLMDNIRYGRIDATDDEVIEAAKKAHAHDFIIKLADGYNSVVGERGLKLSGGQRQRIAIARAILKNAPILILDEATSQLDSVTENLIQESLLDLMNNKTTIVIAHRLSTLLHMDRILAFDNGQIVEDGTHAELLAKGGLYKKLWDEQVGGFLGDNK